MDRDFIPPRLLKGFRDYPPEVMIPREHLLEQARQVYRSYGFAPIDTPALEFADILLGKGYPVHYEEFNGGHDYLSWRGTLAEGIILLLGSAEIQSTAMKGATGVRRDDSAH